MSQKKYQSFKTPFSKGYFLCAAKEFSNLRSIVVASVLCAVAIVVEMYNLILAPSLQVSFSFLPISLCSALTGPLLAIPCGVIVDLVGIAVMGHPFLPGYTLTAVLTAVIYALFLYKSDMSFSRIAGSRLAVDLFVNVLLGSLWRLIYYGVPYVYAVSIAGVKNLLLFPLEIFLIGVFFNAVRRPLAAMGFIGGAGSSRPTKKAVAYFAITAVAAAAATALLVIKYPDIKAALEVLRK